MANPVVRGGSCGEPVNASVRQNHVSEAMDNLVQQLSTLEDVVGQLHEKLVRVVRSEPTQSKDECKPKCGYATPLATDISQQADRVERLVMSLSELKNKIEV